MASTNYCVFFIILLSSACAASDLSMQHCYQLMTECSSNQNQQSDTSSMCKNIDEQIQCITGVKSSCPNLAGPVNGMLNQYQQQKDTYCAASGLPMQHCYQLMTECSSNQNQQSHASSMCKNIDEQIQCINDVKSSCPNLAGPINGMLNQYQQQKVTYCDGSEQGLCHLKLQECMNKINSVRQAAEMCPKLEETVICIQDLKVECSSMKSVHLSSMRQRTMNYQCKNVPWDDNNGNNGPHDERSYCTKKMEDCLSMVDSLQQTSESCSKTVDMVRCLKELTNECRSLEGSIDQTLGSMRQQTSHLQCNNIPWDDESSGSCPTEISHCMSALTSQNDPAAMCNLLPRGLHCLEALKSKCREFDTQIGVSIGAMQSQTQKLRCDLTTTHVVTTARKATTPQYVTTSLPQHVTTSLPQYVTTSLPQYVTTSSEGGIDATVTIPPTQPVANDNKSCKEKVSACMGMLQTASHFSQICPKIDDITQCLTDLIPECSNNEYSIQETKTRVKDRQPTCVMLMIMFSIGVESDIVTEKCTSQIANCMGMYLPITDNEEMCSKIGEVKECIQNLKSYCPGMEKQIQTTITGLEVHTSKCHHTTPQYATMSSEDGIDATVTAIQPVGNEDKTCKEKVSACIGMLQTASHISQICPKIDDITQCLGNLIPQCSNIQETKARVKDRQPTCVMVITMLNGGVGIPRKQCTSHIATCMSKFLLLPDTREKCSKIGEVKGCIKNIKSDCPGMEEQIQTAISGLDVHTSKCSTQVPPITNDEPKDECDIDTITCLAIVESKLHFSKMCPKLNEAVTCLENLKPKKVCSGREEDIQNKIENLDHPTTECCEAVANYEEECKTDINQYEWSFIATDASHCMSMNRSLECAEINKPDCTPTHLKTKIELDVTKIQKRVDECERHQRGENGVGQVHPTVALLLPVFLLGRYILKL